MRVTVLFSCFVYICTCILFKLHLCILPINILISCCASKFLTDEIISYKRETDARVKLNTRWFKYDRDYLCVNKSQFVPVVFESPCTLIPDNVHVSLSSVSQSVSKSVSQ
jgi:hypothetical protein